MNDELLTPPEVAKILQVKVETLEAWRGMLKGPPFIRLTNGKRAPIRYRKSAIESYLTSSTTTPARP